MRIPVTGPAVDPNFETLLDRFYHWEKTTPEEAFLHQPRDGKWIVYSYSDAGRLSRKVAAYLTSKDFPAGSTVGIVSKNCAEWIIYDLGIMMAGHITVPFYANVDAPTFNQLIEHSEIQLLFLGKLDPMDWQNMRSGIPQELECSTFRHYDREGVRDFSSTVHKFRPMDATVVADPHHWATIVYTSGTTGNPKGAIHSFYTIGRTFEYARKEVEKMGQNSRFFSYLPLCHVAERIVVETCCVYTGGAIWFTESIDTFVDNLRTAQPTNFFAVPRIWEKFQEKIFEKISPQRLNVLLSIPLISQVVRKRIKKALGLLHADFVISGAAPLSAELMQWFLKLGIVIREGYGMTESCALATANPQEAAKPGTVGLPYEGIDLQLEPEHQEILIKGDNVMLGYFREPAATEAALKNGYLHTGDIGEFDDEGYLRIVGRVKDMFKTSKGEYIVPTTIEMKLLASELVEQVCVVGVNLPQPLALATLTQTARNLGQPEVSDRLADLMERTNRKLVDYQRLGKMVILDEEWTIETNVLTPTLKIKRNMIYEIYGHAFPDWYAHKELIIWEKE